MASLKYSTAPCCCKDTDVLINQLNIKDSTIIEQAETEINDISSASIDFPPLPYSFPYLQNIHQTLFDDLYA
jgi:fido (protein-threonine AMPylation protein)